MTIRQAGDWITSYLDYAKNTEPPTSYHQWSAISTIASTLQRKVWLPQGHEKIFPNMYIILVGPSGRCRKGTAMGLGLDLLSEIKEIKFAAESITREALIRRMKDAVATVPDPDNPSIMRMHCSLTIFSEELSVFLRQNDLNFLSNLTNWYDSRDRWEYDTKTSGKDTLEGVCVNLMGGTAPDWIQTMMPQEAIGGGFTSRIIFVVEEKKKQTVAKPVINLEKRQLLINDLEQIVKLCGPFEWSPTAYTMYENWYSEQDIMNARGTPAIQDPRFAGYVDRRQTHVRKLAMIFAASRGNDRMVQQEDFERARDLLVATEKKMGRTFGGLGESRYGQVTEKVLRYLQNANGPVLRSHLMKQFYRDMDPDTLEIVEKTLQQMKVLKVKLNPETNEQTYELI